jgi:phenylacetate-coenzyme A ligase PaaK-like adenylate-forming protein
MHSSARQQLLERIRHINPSSFEEVALAVFQYQARYNRIYQQYLNLLKIKPESISTIAQLPFLPISVFKSQAIKTGNWQAQMIFTSSGTTGQLPSQHFVYQPDWYLESARKGFSQFYGPLAQYCILALLPSYLERNGSSLIYMAQDFMRQSGHPLNGFFLDDFEALKERLVQCVAQNQPTVLLGVSFALLDFAEQHSIDLSAIIIMETGGMKGRRKEITRGELHQQLCRAFNTNTIHSEYGMTELFSQAYSKGKGLFYPTASMRVLCRAITDPFAIAPHQKTGVLNIIDLANLDTVSFIATDDLARTYQDGSFEILGRLDHSDLRGCNLMVAELGSKE